MNIIKFPIHYLPSFHENKLEEDLKKFQELLKKKENLKQIINYFVYPENCFNPEFDHYKEYQIIIYSKLKNNDQELEYEFNQQFDFLKKLSIPNIKSYINQFQKFLDLKEKNISKFSFDLTFKENFQSENQENFNLFIYYNEKIDKEFIDNYFIHINFINFKNLKHDSPLLDKDYSNISINLKNDFKYICLYNNFNFINEIIDKFLISKELIIEGIKFASDYYLDLNIKFLSQKLGFFDWNPFHILIYYYYFNENFFKEFKNQYLVEKNNDNLTPIDFIKIYNRNNFII